MSDWMTIDTAPQEAEEQPFLVFTPHEMGGWITVGLIRTDGILCEMASGMVLEEATHWMPLPPSPGEARHPGINAELLESLEDAATRMERARNALTGGKPTWDNSWQMLNAESLRALIERARKS